MKSCANYCVTRYRTVFFCLGAMLSFSLPPMYVIPLLYTAAVLAHFVRSADTSNIAAKYGFWFGFGFFTLGLYWIANSVMVYIDDFWWAIPLAFFGIPYVLAFFIALVAYASWYARSNRYYSLYFSVIWILVEYLRSIVFTGFPWHLICYSSTISEITMQLSSIFGPYGLSFLIIYSVISCIDYTKNIKSYLIFIVIAFTVVMIFGSLRLSNNPTSFTDTKIRLVQPNILQSDKWDYNIILQNLYRHVELSKSNKNFIPDIVIWSEAAVVVPYETNYIKEILTSTISDEQILITGGIDVLNDSHGSKSENLYSNMYAVNSSGQILLNYHKTHLVPFGEYIPFKSFLPIKKLTHGLIDYKSGETEKVFTLKAIRIRPLICYEAIFPSEVRNKNFDAIVNITNDTWFGDSAGPYQHLQISRMRAVENGTPLIRVANSGISAIIDPTGRIISKTKIGAVDVIDGLMPYKLKDGTIYADFGDITCVMLVILVFLLQKVIKIISKSFT